MKTNKLYVISHTHWDREWYCEFQNFRQRLVYNIDKLLELLDTQPDFRCFHMDGHTAWLPDYLEIRPENRERLREHIKNGRISMGDWFVMPDELLLSGESLVRNLLLGYSICQAYGGEPMIAGNVIDVFGHVSQLPQIFKGFGMEGALLQRGTSGEDEHAEMCWEGADGSEILIIKVYPHLGYGDIRALSEVAKDELPAFVRDYEAKKLAFGHTHVHFGLDGNDHTAARWDLPESLAELNGLFADTELIHGSFNDYFRALIQALNAKFGTDYKKHLRRFRGELRTPSKVGLFNETIMGIGSSRVDLKQQNDETEILLARHAEPLHVWSKLCGGQDQKAFLDLAWKYLFYNHPHDSIVGCSIDEVHRDMYYNFRQAQALATNSIRESIQQICAGLDNSAFSACEKTVTVFNMATLTKLVNECAFEIPSEAAQRLEDKGLHPIIVDESGTALPQQLLRVVKRTRTQYLTGIRHLPGGPDYTRHPPEGMRVHRYHLAIADEIAPLSFHSYGIKYIAADTLPVFAPRISVCATSRTMENGLLRAHVRADGRLDIHDLETGAEYKGLLHYVDCGDAGNGWYHIYPRNDTIISSLTADNWQNVIIELTESGPLMASFQVSGELMIPHGLDEEKRERIGQVAVKIVNILTMTAGEKRIDCKTIIANNAKQHRLQVLLPVSKALNDAEYYFADTAFDCLERRIKAIDTKGWVETFRPEAPFKSFLGIRSEKTPGLALITKGICEGHVMDDKARTLALTLYRSFSQNIEAIDSVDSLLLGELILEYAIVPLKAGGDAGVEMFAEVERYKQKPYFYTAALNNNAGDVPLSCLIELDKDIALSTVKAAEDGGGIIVRCFNPAAGEIRARIKPLFDYQLVSERDLRERFIKDLEKESDGSLNISFGAKQIITLLFALPDTLN